MQLTQAQKDALAIALASKEAADDLATAIEAGANPQAASVAALLLAYIDDGIARVDMPTVNGNAKECFELFKTVCVKTFAGCGFTIERAKCFPSDVFFIFLNEPYHAGRHIIHGTRAAAAVCSTQNEEHEALPTVIDKAATGCRGAVVAGLDGTAAMILMAVHANLIITEWVGNMDPVLKALFCFVPRAWAGLGMPTEMQLSTTTSGDAYVESLATIQCWARCNPAVKNLFLAMMRAAPNKRSATSIGTSPMSVHHELGYMKDSRATTEARRQLARLAHSGVLSPLAESFLQHADPKGFAAYCSSWLPAEHGAAIQEVVVADLVSVHPQSLYSAFTRRIEKARTFIKIVGWKRVQTIISTNRAEAVWARRVLLARVATGKSDPYVEMPKGLRAGDIGLVDVDMV